MSIKAAYDDWSATYDSDRNLTRDLDHVATREILQDQDYKQIVELGSGTGKNTLFLSQIGERVCALDFSEGMLSQAKEKVRSDNVRFAVADITKYWPLEGHRADLVVCNLVLEYIEKLAFVFAEANRCLVPQGHFLICELHPFRQYQGVQARFIRAQRTTEIPAFVHHITDFLNAGETNRFTLKALEEWWHAEDKNMPPRLLSLLFEK